MNNVVTEVQKEKLGTLNFPNEDVLTSKEDRTRRKLNLRRASILGNIDHTKMRIIFKDSFGIKKVTTTVWANTEKYVILKGSKLIPCNRILDIY